MGHAFLLLFLISSLFSSDYDCILIGSSPFSLFEALYQHYCGKKVLVLEEAYECGGAWKSIEVCGIPNVDLGCHQIGHDLQLKNFFESYTGCHIVSLDDPSFSFEEKQGLNGWYFSKGCKEMIGNLVEMIAETEIDLNLGEKAESVTVDPLKTYVTVLTDKNTFMAKKVILTPMSNLTLSHFHSAESVCSNQYYHLYLLIEDASPFQFTYRPGGGKIPGALRMMNCTPFIELQKDGLQLISLQVRDEKSLSEPDLFFNLLKEASLISPEARLLETDTYIYKSKLLYQPFLREAQSEHLIEVLQTGHIHNLSRYIPKWEKVLKPYNPFLESNSFPSS